MAFFGIAAGGRGGQRARATGRSPAAVSIEFLHKHECAACPLNNQRGLRHPNMPASGAARPRAYFIGEAPGADEDLKGEPFVGKAGRVLRRRIPGRWLSDIRFNNVVRTRPPKNRTPVRVEIEACRPSVLRDIEATQPEAIVGFGNVPLGWAGISESGITLWSGRRVPVLIGDKPRWFFPIVHPSAVLRDPKRRERGGDYGSELEFQFAVHIRRALQAIEAGLPEPVVHTREFAEAGIAWVTGEGGRADVDRVVEHLRRAAARKIAGLDYETTGGLRPYAEGAKILSAAVSTVDGTLAFPLDHRGAKWTPRQRADVGGALREFLYADGCRKVVHQLAYEMEWSAHFFGKECLRASRWGCSVSQAYVLDERVGAHNLEFLCKQYFGIDVKALGGVKSERANLDAVDLPRVLRYNGLDAKYHCLLYGAQSEALREAGLSRLYAEHVERVPTAVLTQLRGIPVDQAAVVDMGKKYAAKMRKAEAELRSMEPVRKFERASGAKFRPSANDDVKAVLRGLGIRVESVDEDALATVEHEFARKEVDWRKAAKVFSTYVLPCAVDETREALGIDLADPKLRPSRVYSDGLAHPLTNVNRTRTSRTSAEDFNYQNWPKRGETGSKEIRRMVKPLEPGEVIVSFDYGQIQARNVAMESLDPALIEAFWNDYDVHTDYMEEIARLYPRWVKEGVRALATDKALAKKYRNRAKNEYVFPSFFGAQPKSKAEVLGVPQSVAEALDRDFWGRFNKIKRWHTRVEHNYYKDGYVTGLSGYRRGAPVSFNERINSPIQADESKIVLDAMTRLSKIDHDWLQANMEIHDDLTFVWPKRRVDELAEIVIREMLTVPFEWARVVPILIEMEIGKDWADMGSPDKFGHERLGAGKFASHQYDEVDMPKEPPR